MDMEHTKLLSIWIFRDWCNFIYFRDIKRVSISWAAVKSAVYHYVTHYT